MAEIVEAEVPLEPGALLPEGEGVAGLPGGQAPPETAHEQRRGRREIVSLGALPSQELLELCA